MLEEIKKLLRITGTAFNDEVQGLIDECKEDLRLTGVRSETIDEDDIMIKRAIRTYCKANFGFENADRDRLLMSYEALKQHLKISVEYGSDYVA
jgi:superfamily II DNA/RNA helicase